MDDGKSKGLQLGGMATLGAVDVSNYSATARGGPDRKY